MENSMKRRIGIFGCTADPFTLAHREIVKQVLEQKRVDKVIIAPTIVSWHREGKSSWLSDDAKEEVIRRLLRYGGDIPESAVSVYTRDLTVRALCEGNAALEDRFVNAHRFIDTLVDIKTNYPDDDIYVIMGNDSWEKLETWSNWKEIAALAKMVLVADGRKSAALFKENPNVPNAKKFSIGSKYANVSASSIRKKFDSFEDYTACMKQEIEGNGKVLLHTPIFDVAKGKRSKTGLEPILVNAPDWVTVIVESKGKFLVEKQWRYGSASMVEEFPCGMVEKGEDPLDAAVRELEEETGFKLLDKSKVIKIGQASPNPAFMTNTMHYFYVDLSKAKYTKTMQKLDTHESIKFFFKDMDKFCQDILERAADGKSKIPAMLMSAIALVSMHKMKGDDSNGEHN